MDGPSSPADAAGTAGAGRAAESAATLGRALGVPVDVPELAASLALATFAAGLGAAWQRETSARERWLAVGAGTLAGLVVVIADEVLLPAVPVQAKAAGAGLLGRYVVGFAQAVGTQVIASSGAIVQGVLARLGLGGGGGSGDGR